MEGQELIHLGLFWILSGNSEMLQKTKNPARTPEHPWGTWRRGFGVHVEAPGSLVWCLLKGETSPLPEELADGQGTRSQ